MFITTQLDERNLLFVILCSLHLIFKARCGNLLFCILLTFVTYTLCSANISKGQTLVSKRHLGELENYPFPTHTHTILQVLSFIFLDVSMHNYGRGLAYETYQQMLTYTNTKEFPIWAQVLASPLISLFIHWTLMSLNIVKFYVYKE